MNWQEIVALVFFSLAAIFAVGGLIGLFRFSDPFSAMQASSLLGTTTVFSLFIGCLFLVDSFAMAARIVIIIAFFLISGPTGSSIVARFIWDYFQPEAKKSLKSRTGEKEESL
ncbi:multisubunit Na+/H+ antiporter, MnhG subunit [Sphaerochaeta pleomorpha str. Grapes]|uniref:Multisubunit Na+/H+ antiporter, MnhG subunit n=1 Tax=Sphaerochaeta pleomorpha (strain ATCC BAA-1885 / DSM 22778 / Grapes) TaxID=158190 RepID=G8QTU7_SPHPG|nr:monovalent cation/H(+) antiporter subunit G [Sphaerochaeta pleomorpha]AEV29123.1 multisubunit Na+/H+ antiporter, MnhG subunit [Sphaerochaeta pleomorpha str. Grapes]